jgi:hypothetical protein
VTGIVGEHGGRSGRVEGTDCTIPAYGICGLLLLTLHYGNYRLQLNAEEVKNLLSLVLRSGVVNKQRSKSGKEQCWASGEG